MSGLIGSLQASGRARATIGLGLAVAAFLGAGVWSSSARASGCTNTFKNTAGGSWFTAANWSKKAIPASGEEVCITEGGTYTVELVQSTSVPTLKSLTIGAGSGTQSLLVASTSSVNASLVTTEGLGNGAHSAITLTNSPTDSDANGVTLGGPITNAGTIVIETDRGGFRRLEGSLTSTGTIKVDAGTEFDGEAKTLTNDGALEVANEKTLSISGKSGVLNGAGVRSRVVRAVVCSWVRGLRSHRAPAPPRQPPAQSRWWSMTAR